MSRRTPRFSIILAGGRGKRMRSADLHKVCFPIDGEPAISRAIRVHKECGIENHVVVVGTMAEQVMKTVTRDHSGVVFAYQPDQIGTADAARRGEQALASVSDDEDVLVVAGDKVLEPSVLRQLIQLYFDQACDLAFVTGPKEFYSGLGRIVLGPDGRVLGNVEELDVRQREVYRTLRARARGTDFVLASELTEVIVEHFDRDKSELAFAEIRDLLEDPSRKIPTAEILASIPEGLTLFSFTDATGEVLLFSPTEVEMACDVNQSVYVVKRGLLRHALESLSRDNAQGEEYLSDMITILSQGADDADQRLCVSALKVDDPHAIMGFNNPEELLEIEDHLRSRHGPPEVLFATADPSYRTIQEWTQDFRELEAGGLSAQKGALWNHLGTLYSDDAGVLCERAADYLGLLDFATSILAPSERVLIVRSPGRINLLGRHIDHQGGNCNVMTIGYETLMIAHPRCDDCICLYNLDADRFPERSFTIGEMLVDLPWEDWLSLVNSDAVSRMTRDANGDWSQYVKAAALRLQKRYGHTKLRGLDLVVAGRIPVAAGLSSSSAIVVGVAEALIALNRLDVMPRQLVDLCGESEWFVGTRGGSADHAAIKFGQKGRLIKVAFFEFAIEEVVPFPEDFVLAICDSATKAHKTEGARGQFNQRIACYRVGLLLIKSLFPQFAPLITHLRDVNTRSLGVPLSTIYAILEGLPETVTRLELEELLPDVDLEPLFCTHSAPRDGNYPIRGVVLFGLAECERSREFASLLRDRRLDEIRLLMQASHDGDRVSVTGRGGQMTEYCSLTSDDYLQSLIADLESHDPARVLRAQLDRQPGGYRCSTIEIDNMVDVSLAVDGVVGAQLAGAGLGGCMMVLLHRNACDVLDACLREQYYEPRNLEPAILFSDPVAGSGVLFRE